VKRAAAVVFALVGLSTFAAYVPSLGNGFVDWDDNVNITANESYRGLGKDNLVWMFTSFRLGHYQPLAWVTLGLDYVVWGMRPFGYHLTSSILHALAAVLFAATAARIFAVARKAAGTAPLEPAAVAFGAIVALAWSLHPLRVEAVAWVTERREVLCGLFTLLSVGSHLRGRPKWQTWVFAVLAMLSKVTAATIPALLVLIDIHRDGATTLRGILASLGRSILRHAPVVVVAVLLVLAAVLAQREAEAFVSWSDLSFFRRLVLTFHGAAFCLLKTLWPSGLAVLHQGKIGSTWELHGFVWWQAGLGFLLTALALVAGWKTRRAGLGPLCLLAAFFVLVLPTGGFAQSGPQTSADRYTYQAGWVLTLAIGLLLARGTGWPGRIWSWRVAAPLVALLGLLAVLSIRQQGVWFDSETLWQRQIEVHPASPTGNHQLGRHYVGRRPPRFDLAEPCFRAAFAGNPDYVEPQHALGLLLRNTGRTDEAIEVFKNIVRRWPMHRDTWFQLGMLLWESGDRANAVSGFDNYLRLDRTDAAAWRLLAKAQAAAGKPQEAVATLEAGIAAVRAPTLSGDLAWILATHPDAAMRDGKRALELASKAFAATAPDVRTVVMFAAACAEAGEFERGMREVESAIPKLPREAGPAMHRLLEDLSRREVIRAEPRFP
jgi:protein O-mannosyl-transferase